MAARRKVRDEPADASPGEREAGPPNGVMPTLYRVPVYWAHLWTCRVPSSAARGSDPRAPWDRQSDHRSRESTAGRMGRLVSALPVDRQMVVLAGGGAATRRPHPTAGVSFSILRGPAGDAPPAVFPTPPRCRFRAQRGIFP